MADEHHEDHGNTVAAWFLTLSWIVVWTAAGLAIMFDENVVRWTALGLGASILCAVVAGLLKKAGMGREHPRPTPLTREAWEALRAERADAAGAEDPAKTEAGEEHETAAAH